MSFVVTVGVADGKAHSPEVGGGVVVTSWVLKLLTVFELTGKSTEEELALLPWTVMVAEPVVAIRLGLTVASNTVPVINVVASDVPDHWMTLPASNPDPVTTKVN